MSNLRQFLLIMRGIFARSGFCHGGVGSGLPAGGEEDLIEETSVIMLARSFLFPCIISASSEELCLGLLRICDGVICIEAFEQ